MLKIRLSRIGRKHEPVYRLILTDSRNPAQTGRSVETLGSYDSRRGDKAVFDGERVNYWVAKGAQLSDTVHNLLVSRGIIKGSKRNVLSKGVIEAARKKAEPEPEPAVDVAEAPAPTEEVTPTEEVVVEAPVEAPAEAPTEAPVEESVA